MLGFRKAVEREVTVGFRVAEYLVEVVDILCKSEDLNRSQFLRRALDSYEPMRSAIDEFEKEMLSAEEKQQDI
jgi:hypothetical protein